MQIHNMSIPHSKLIPFKSLQVKRKIISIITNHERVVSCHNGLFLDLITLVYFLSTHSNNKIIPKLCFNEISSPGKIYQAIH